MLFYCLKKKYKLKIDIDNEYISFFFFFFIDFLLLFADPGQAKAALCDNSVRMLFLIPPLSFTHPPPA